MNKQCIILWWILAIASTSNAESPNTDLNKSTTNSYSQSRQQTRISPMDYLGNRVPGQHYEKRGQKIVPTDYLGNRLQGSHYQIKGDKIYRTDHLGIIETNKP